MISLTRRISIGTVLLTAAVVGVAVALVWLAARWQTVRLLDRELDEHASRLARDEGWRPPPAPEDGGDWEALLSGVDRGPTRPGPAPPPLQAGTGWIFVQVVDERGGEVFRSPSLPATGPALADLLAGAAPGAATWVRLAGRPLRALRLADCRPPPDFGAPRPFGVRCQAFVGRDAVPALAELDRLVLTLAAVWATASLFAVLAAWWLRRSVIGPLERVSAGIRAIDPERPAGRVDAEVPEEMAESVRLLNGLLDRLAGVLEREKGTIATIAHELRSPIAGLRTTLEVAALEGGGGGEVAMRCLPTVVAMQGMVANLLILTRLEAGQEAVQVEEVDLDELLDSCWAAVRPIAAARGQRLLRLGGAGRVRTCPDHARILLGNLLDNACTHAPDGAGIGLDAAVVDGRCRLRLANPFTGPAPDPQRIFDPFWRGDAARTSPLHCGLGLALARRLSLLLGADLRVTVAGEVFTAELGFDRAA